MDFYTRQGNYQFIQWSPLWGYLPQIHEWGMIQHSMVYWEVTRVNGPDHQPVFQAVPICMYSYVFVFNTFLTTKATGENQVLNNFARTGFSKKAAKESAARAMAMSGNCVSILSHSCMVHMHSKCSLKVNSCVYMHIAHFVVACFRY